MKLRDRVLEKLAEMVTGDNPLFPYRSSRFITGFFKRCGFDFVHDGSTRRLWTKDRFIDLNLGTSHEHDLPSDDLVRIISELFDQDDFEDHRKEREPALEGLNRLLVREGLAAYFDLSGRCYVRNTGTGISSSTLPQQPRPLSREEITKRQKLAHFLDLASEDEFTRAPASAPLPATGFSSRQPRRAQGKDAGVRQRPLDEVSASNRALDLLLRSGKT
jgi:hypothetical protein